MLILAFFEGIGIKTSELVSNINMYSGNNSLYYIIICEKIFCLVRVIFLCIFYLFNISLITMLYIFIIFIFFIGFIYSLHY